MPWSGGPPETWAYRYYDAVPTGDPDRIEPVDVLAASALHPGLTRAELRFFRDRRHDIERWLEVLPAVAVQESDESLRVLEPMVEWSEEVSLALLTKVLHRKRPDLIPPTDSHLVRHYLGPEARLTPESWFELLGGIRCDIDRHDGSDQPGHSTNAEANGFILSMLGVNLQRRGVAGLSWIRMIDIVLWMREHEPTTRDGTYRPGSERWN